ncbi:putative fungal-specific transcription factor [Xylaria flabelliformis]|nr:putative fungal-specific transcription factor [Xylaria flabelliformis]
MSAYRHQPTYVPPAAGIDPARQRPRPPPNRRRDKPQLSCNLCRRRKLRCDRQHPCSTCKKRGLDPSCTYATDNTASTPPAGVQDRLRHLENLVVSYMNQNEGPALSPSAQSCPNIQEPDASHAPPDVGSLKSNSTETQYQDQTHYKSILNAITELKEDFRESDDPRSDRIAAESSSVKPIDAPLLYGCKHCSKEEILAAVPSREFADCLVSECFEMLELSSCAINKRGFLKEYASFWEEPQSVPVMWLGLLFSIFSIAVNFREFDIEQVRSGPALDYVSLSASYREKTVQCLILGQYTRCGPYVLETLLHHFAAEFMRRRDVNNEAWIILSTTVHLAMRMGYHRDPHHFKSISPYDGELRRRVWAMLYHLDIATSGQLGVPRLINDAFVDTAEPRNLFDSDFEPSSIELPPSRPDTDPTPMLVVLSKLRTARMYTTVISTVTNTQPPTYAQVLQVDRQIEDMFLKIPEYCRIKPISDSIADPPSILLQRIFIQMNHHKAQVILHWRYLTLANKDDRYSYSTKTTVTAALKILKLHQTIYDGLKTGGRLYSVRWRITCFFSHDYLLATSILCFYLQRNGDRISKSELNEIKQTLRQTKVIWGPRTPTSAEVKRAAAAIELVLPGILGQDSDESSIDSQGVPTPAGSSDLSAFSNDQDPFVGSISPFFDPMFEGAPMFPSHINDMGAFIDSVLAGSVDPCVEASINTQYPIYPFC